MKNSILALPALLRAGTFLAIASPSAFNVQDDLLAFPQYEIDFADDFVTESDAQARLVRQARSSVDAVANLDLHKYPSEWPKDGEEAEVTYEPMTLEGQRYLCEIPRIKEPEIVPGAANDTLSKADEEKELARAKDRGWELLSGMEGNCVYFLSGWWSYKFCYNDIVRQFHQLPPSAGVPPFPPKEDPGVPGYTLGKYSPIEEKDVGAEKSEISGQSTVADVGGKKEVKDVGNPHKGKLVQKGDQRYLVQTLSGGSLCDLTHRGRRTEVQFHCNPLVPDRIHLIKETSTCDYLMIIQTPRLCQDVAFLPPKTDSPNPITCSLILAEDQIDDYKADMASIRKAAKAAASAKNYPPLRQVVGDIEIGAHNIVPPDVKLEKSAIVGGGKETYVDTIASSDGKLLGKDELAKYGLGDPSDVAELKKKLEMLAGGDEWRLVVIDTPRGREYKGIIGASDEEGGDKKEGEEKGGEKDKEGEKKKDKKAEKEGSKEEYFKDEL